MATTIVSLFRNEAAPQGLGAPRIANRPQIAIRPVSAPRPPTIDAELIAVLDRPLGLGETAHAGYACKEQELGNLFATLSWMDSRAMYARLSSPKAGDELANKFARLTMDRRMRLLNFIADARRRAAIAGAR